jgi:hypothetical protein
MFSYNTSFHRATQITPFFLTFGLEACQPGLSSPELCQKFYGDSNDTCHLLLATDVTQKNNENATARTTQYANLNTSPHPFREGQLVLLNEHSFLHKKSKTSCQMERASLCPIP